MLLRTLDADHTTASRVGDQLVPCCGHFWIEDGAARVLVLGCPYGLDWDVCHDAGNVALRFSDRPDDVRVSSGEWRDVVVAFCDAVHDFQETSLPKAPPGPDNIEGVAAFRAEWQHRYARARGRDA